MLEPELFERVAAGATRLDATYPGWWESIPTDRIDMGTASCCILGHLYGDYANGVAQVFMPDWWWTETGSKAAAFSRLLVEATAHGFDSETRSDAECERLRLAWIDEIEERLALSHKAADRSGV